MTHKLSKFYFVFVLLINIQLVICKPCPGKCVKNCTSRGGKILAYCTNELACCDFSHKQVGSCGATMSEVSAIFQSPNYPQLSSGDLTCSFHFNLSLQHYDGLLVEFDDVETEGPGFAHHSGCEADMIFLRGFRNWQPTSRCGNLTGYSVVIHKTKHSSKMKSLEVFAVMSSVRYKWKIKVSLLQNRKVVDRVTTTTTEKELETTTESSESETLSVNVNEVEDAQSLNNWRYRFNREEKISRSLDLEETELDLEEPLIVNGVDTDITQVPWQASIRQYYPDYIFQRLKIKPNDTFKYNQEKAGCAIEGKHFCGGSIISDQHILSAAHCFSTISKVHGWKRLDVVKVFLGETDLCQDDGLKYGRTPQNFSIEKIIFHYGWDDINMAMNDVLILKLKGKIKFNEYIKPIALTKRSKEYAGQEAKASGWGLTNLTVAGAPIPLLLQSMDGIIVGNQSYCGKYLKAGFGTDKWHVNLYPKYYGIFDSVICTMSKTDSVSKLVGQGDSGGPLIILDKFHEPPIPIQIGIVSYGLPALNAKHPHDNVFVDYFQNVSYYRDWIDLAMTV